MEAEKHTYFAKLYYGSNHPDFTWYPRELIIKVTKGNFTVHARKLPMVCKSVISIIEGIESYRDRHFILKNFPRKHETLLSVMVKLGFKDSEILDNGDFLLGSFTGNKGYIEEALHELIIDAAPGSVLKYVVYSGMESCELKTFTRTDRKTVRESRVLKFTKPIPPWVDCYYKWMTRSQWDDKVVQRAKNGTFFCSDDIGKILDLPIDSIRQFWRKGITLGKLLDKARFYYFDKSLQTTQH